MLFRFQVNHPMFYTLVLLLGSVFNSANAEGLPETIVRRYPVGEMRSCAATLTISSNVSNWAYEVRLDGHEWRLGPRFSLEKTSMGSVIRGLVGKEVLQHTLSSLTTGPHRVEVRVLDRNGRRDPSPFTAEWTIHEPTLEFVSHMPARVAPLGDHWVEVRSSAAKYAFDYSIDDGPWQYGDASLKGRGKGSAAVVREGAEEDVSRLTFTEAPRAERQRVKATGVAGPHSIRLRPIDQCGNRGAVITSQWVTSWATTTMHLEPPSGGVAIPATSVVFSTSADLPAFFIEHSLDGAEWVRSSKMSKAGVPVHVTLNQLAEREHTLLVRALDSYARPDYMPKEFKWTTDRTAPVVRVASAAPSKKSAGAFTLELEVQDFTPTTLHLDLDQGDRQWTEAVTQKTGAGQGAPGKWRHTLELRQLKDGDHSLRVRAVDSAGNWARQLESGDLRLGSHSSEEEKEEETKGWALEVPFHVDAAPPTTSMAEGPERYTSDTTARFWFTVSERGATMMYSLDEAPFQRASEPMLEFGGLKDGPHTMRVYCIDAAGNREKDVLTHQWNVDTVPPHTAIHAGWGSPERPRYAVSALPGEGETWDAFVYNFEYRVDEDEWVSGEKNARLGPGYEVWLTGLAPGPHTFTARAIDLAGNVDPNPASHSFHTPAPATNNWSEVETSGIEASQPSIMEDQLEDVAQAMEDLKVESRGWFGFRAPRRTYGSGSRGKFFGELRR